MDISCFLYYRNNIKHIGFYCYGCRGCVINDYGHLWCTLLLYIV